ncbi:hypothetical protein NPIL_32381 [Nephila pilipes]|uniref:Uncharacterized protein n=1 Tax=Nephila pilipes TaxID=299642 RepID=A0A8X6Q0S3_NEPPI|nr:hypothetical protein NPIL_32381 [Nephila pilipes]
MNTFEILKAKRSVLRGRLTKFMAKTESILDSSVEDTDSDEILELLEHINKRENDLNIVNSEIEIAITDPTVFDNEFKTSEEYSDKITIIKFRIKNRIQKINALDNRVVEKRESRPAQSACLKLPKTHVKQLAEFEKKKEERQARSLENQRAEALRQNGTESMLEKEKSGKQGPQEDLEYLGQKLTEQQKADKMRSKDLTGRDIFIGEKRDAELEELSEDNSLNLPNHLRKLGDEKVTLNDE